MKALIVIDVQNDFCPGGALAVAQGDMIVPGMNALMADFDAVILTQDWHPAGHSSFASSHEGAEVMSVIELAYGPQVLWPDHCVQGSSGSDLHAELDLKCAQLIIRKGFNPALDSYSAFFENDKITATGLDGYFKSLGVEKINLVGLATDFCVNYSAQDAAKLGYTVSVFEGMCRAIDLNGSLELARNEMRDCGVELI